MKGSKNILSPPQSLYIYYNNNYNNNNNNIYEGRIMTTDTGEFIVICPNCNYEWKARTTNPKKCPSCQKWLPKWKHQATSTHPILVKALGGKCANCETTEDLQIHHIDGNMYNNEESNLIVYCRKCHNNIGRNRGIGKRITVVLEEENEKLLRDQNHNKGDLSKIVNEALREQFNSGIKVGESQISQDGSIEIPAKVRDLLKLSQGDTVLIFGKKAKKELILRKSLE